MVGGFGYDDGDNFMYHTRGVPPINGFFASEESRVEQEASVQLQDISAELNNLPPLNLTLRKTPSFLNLLKTKLSTRSGGGGPSASASELVPEKLKASNFPASFIKIGSWQEVSKNETDLVAKCYFSKKKMVWEVLRNGLKSKIEIQWSDISAIRASLRENQPGVLEIELDQIPAFYQESMPQPRKHTIWHMTADFTEGQASTHRRHYVRFPPGTLDRHYEKLLQCDRRLLDLSNKGFPSHDSPYFNWTPYEYNTYYYSFDNNDNNHPSPEVKPQVVQFPTPPSPEEMVYHQQIQSPQWAIQPPLTSPMSGSRDNTTMEFTNDHRKDHGFGDPRIDIWGHGNHQHISIDSDNMGFGLLERESSNHSLMGSSSGGMDYSTTLSYPSGYVDSIITSCTSHLVDSEDTHHQLSLTTSYGNAEGREGFDNGFLYPPFTQGLGIFEDPSRMKMNWY